MRHFLTALFMTESSEVLLEATVCTTENRTTSLQKITALFLPSCIFIEGCVEGDCNE
jgi:hypothetical protein